MNSIKEFKFGSDDFRNYFRTQFIDHDAGWDFLKFKDGALYKKTIFTIALIVPIIACSFISTWKLSFLYLVPLYIFVANGIEYFLHRYPMHHKMRGFEFLFEHVIIHHNFYSESYLKCKDPRDYFAVFLPLKYLIFISIEILIIGLLVTLIGGRDHGLFFIATAYIYYFFYELFHYSAHSDTNENLKRMLGIDRLSKLHLLHHDTSLMQKYNFNISLPIFDILLGTLYRGSSSPRTGARQAP